MALEASERLILRNLSQLGVYLWMYLKAYLQTKWENGEISQDLKKSGSSLGAISKCLKVPRSSVQTIVRKYKHNGTTAVIPLRKETCSVS